MHKNKGMEASTNRMVVTKKRSKKWNIYNSCQRIKKCLLDSPCSHVVLYVVSKFIPVRIFYKEYNTNPLCKDLRKYDKLILSWNVSLPRIMWSMLGNLAWILYALERKIFLCFIIPNGIHIPTGNMPTCLFMCSGWRNKMYFPLYVYLTGATLPRFCLL